MTILDLLKARVSSLDILNHKDTSDSRHGVTPGGFHKDADGAAWYVKHHDNPDHAHVEHVANQVYRAAGHNAPHSMVLHDARQRPVYFSKKIEGFKTLQEHWRDTNNPRVHNYDGEYEHWKRAGEDHAAKHFKGLAADYLLHGTDMHTGNVGLVGHGDHATPTRIDNGGAMHLNAYGSSKWSESLNHGLHSYVRSHHDQALSALAGHRDIKQTLDRVTSPKALRPQVKKLAEVRKAHGGWEGFVEKHAPSAPDHVKAAMVNHLNERHERLLQHVTGVQDWSQNKENHPAPPVAPPAPRRGTASIQASNDRWMANHIAGQARPSVEHLYQQLKEDT